jgi:signal peptidase I
LSDDVFDDLGISKDDRILVNAYQQAAQLFTMLGFKPSSMGYYNPVYHLPLTQENVQKLKKYSEILSIKIEPQEFGGNTFPLGNKGWSRDNYGPIWMPKKGATVKVNASNYNLYEHIIRNYEHNTLALDNGRVIINGKATDTYTFKMDYYWMMGDNRHNSADSRYWGFVPEDHIVGQPVFVWLSLDKDKSLFEGKIRFERFFKSALR